MSDIILFNKPYGVLSQFRSDDNNDFGTLANFFTDKSLRVVGRLDATSEGLLLLTSDGRVNRAITQPPKHIKDRKQGKTYLVQVEGTPTPEQLAQLTQGILLKDGMTLPALVQHLEVSDLPLAIWPRVPPIRERKSVPTAWLMLTIYEGKNRQVRRMTAHVGLPCLRLVRCSVASFELGNIEVGKFVRVHLNAARLAQLGIN